MDDWNKPGEWDKLVERLAATFDAENFTGSVKFLMDNGRNVHIANNDGQIVLRSDCPDSARAELKMTMKDAAAIVNRKLSPMKAIVTLRLKVKGDMSQAIRVAGCFARPLPPELAV